MRLRRPYSRRGRAGDLHDYQFLGGDFRERERIKRKTVRWTARIAKLPQLERIALLSALASTGEIDGPGSRVVFAEARRPKPAASAMPVLRDRRTLEMQP